MDGPPTSPIPQFSWWLWNYNIKPDRKRVLLSSIHEPLGRGKPHRCVSIIAATYYCSYCSVDFNVRVLHVIILSILYYHRVRHTYKFCYQLLKYLLRLIICRRDREYCIIINQRPSLGGSYELITPTSLVSFPE